MQKKLLLQFFSVEGRQQTMWHKDARGLCADLTPLHTPCCETY